ncbi:hypothetical protein ES702_06572 [subsurface metagenome]
MKKLLGPILIALTVIGCATTSFLEGAVTDTVTIRPTAKEEIQDANSVRIVGVKCDCSAAKASAIKDAIEGRILPTGVRILGDRAVVDIVIEVTVTHISDSMSSASGVAVGGNDVVGGYAAAGGYAASGRYVSSMGAKLLNKGGEVLAMTSYTQLRTPRVIPGPASAVASFVGKQIQWLLKGEKPLSYEEYYLQGMANKP